MISDHVANDKDATRNNKMSRTSHDMAVTGLCSCGKCEEGRKDSRL